MLRLTLELSGDSMRRTPTVAVAANGAKVFFCQSFDWASLADALRFDSGRPPLRCCWLLGQADGIDALTESWCAPLHQAVPCAQRQDVVVAHQPGVGGYFTNQFTPARERKCRQLECMLERCYRTED